MTSSIHRDRHHLRLSDILKRNLLMNQYIIQYIRTSNFNMQNFIKIQKHAQIYTIQ